MITSQLEAIVDAALAEDLSGGDITTESLVPPEVRARASVVAKQEGVLAGTEVARLVFQRVDPGLNTHILAPDGTRVSPGQEVATIRGSAASILKAERTALNFLQHLSGIATETARCIEAVSGTEAHIVDTRKTSPGLRLLEKYAVRVGGGHNHRMNLGAGILIKDNHLAALGKQEAVLREAIERACEHAPHSATIQVEVQTLEQVREALDAGADALLLDNMSIKDIRKAVELAGGTIVIEASGGITLENVRAVAETGVDLISVGALTHSARALDLSLGLERE